MNLQIIRVVLIVNLWNIEGDITNLTNPSNITSNNSVSYFEICDAEAENYD